MYPGKSVSHNYSWQILVNPTLECSALGRLQNLKGQEAIKGLLKVKILQKSGGRGGGRGTVGTVWFYKNISGESRCNIAVVYQKPKLSAETESFQLSAFGFGRRK